MINRVVTSQESQVTSVPKDGVDPWLVETLVDRQRFYGGCYRAANWTVLGETSGRGRMDRTHKRHGAQVKTILVYPLVKNARRRLTIGG